MRSTDSTCAPGELAFDRNVVPKRSLAALQRTFFACRSTYREADHPERFHETAEQRLIRKKTD